MSCGKGIEPIETGYGSFSGKITFKGEWPSGIKRTHLVLFRDYIRTEQDFFPPNLSYVSNEIDSGTVMLEYNSSSNNLLGVRIESGYYRYIVVAQSTKEELSLDRKDWFVVGVYFANGNTSQPGYIQIYPDEETSDVDIVCDFDNPPPQPPGG